MKIKVKYLNSLLFALFLVAVFGVGLLFGGQNMAVALAEQDNSNNSLDSIADYTATATANGNIVTRLYGESITLTAQINRTLDQAETLTYQWYRVHVSEDESTNEQLINQKSITLMITNVAQSGTYFCEITLHKEDNSLTKNSNQISVTITPREVQVNWSNFDNLIYDGTSQLPTSVARGIGSYFIPLSVAGAEIEAGNNYTAIATSLDDNYKLMESSRVRTFSIKPMEISIVWSEIDARFVYNGEYQAPTATATGIDGYVIAVTVSGAGKDAKSEGSYYTAVASIDENNYVLARTASVSTTRFFIDPLEINILWQSQRLTYNGTAQHPVAIANGIGEYIVPLTYIGTGIDVRPQPYSTLVSTSDINYKILNDTVLFDIVPLLVGIEWDYPNKFEYTRRDQISSITARYRKADNTLAPLTIAVADDRVFRDAGTYTITAQMPLTVLNYALAEGAQKTRTITINKSTPTVIIDDKNPTFTYNGNRFQIDARLSNDEKLLFYQNGQLIENRFVEAGRYNVVITSPETDNYLPALAVVVNVTVKDIYYSITTEEIEGDIKLSAGYDPDAILAISEIDAEKLGYNQQWARSVDTAFEVWLNLDGRKLDIKHAGTLKVKLSEKHAKQEKLRVISLKDGRYVEQIVENEDGYITINLYESGKYAITYINDDFVLIWWIVMGSLGVIFIIAIIVYFALKRTRIG